MPSRASSKQCDSSRWDVYIVTWWPRFWRASATSIIKRSAPPMPRSGWIMMTFDSGTRLILTDLLYCPIEGELSLFCRGVVEFRSQVVMMNR